jgi:hypothetical protein
MANFKILNISDFGGGQSDSDYEAAVGQFYAAQDFDIFTDPKVLMPNYPMGNDTQLTAFSAQILGSYQSYGIDLYCSANSGVLLKKSNTSAWATAVSNSAITSGKLTEYKDRLIWGTNFYYPATGNVSANALSAATNITYKHAPSDEIYFAATNSIHAYDGTTFTPVATTLPLNYDVKGMTSWENYIAIGASDRRENDTSKIFLWDTYSMLPEAIVDIGDAMLRAIANVNGVIVIVTIPNDIHFYEWRGGKVYKTKTIKTSAGSNIDASGDSTISASNPVVKNGILYIALGGNVNFSQGIYAYKPHATNPSQASLVLDRTVAGITSLYNLTIPNIHLHSTSVWKQMYANLLATGDGTYRIANKSDTVRSGGIYQSVIYEPFPGQASQPARISMEYKPLPASTALSAFTKVDNATDWTFIGSTGASGTVKNDFYDRSGYAFDIGNYHQYKISATGKAELLKLIVKFRDAENR